MKKKNHELHVIMYLFAAIFLAVTAWFCYYVAFKAPKAINSSYNMRQANLEKKVIRGMILSSTGDILAEEAMNREEWETARAWLEPVADNNNAQKLLRQIEKKQAAAEKNAEPGELAPETGPAGEKSEPSENAGGQE